MVVQPTPQVDPHAHHLASCSPHRILHLYAEENAIDDTIYYLSEALRKGVISLDVFLKVTDCVLMCAGMCGGDVCCGIRTLISYVSYTYCGMRQMVAFD